MSALDFSCLHEWNNNNIFYKLDLAKELKKMYSYNTQYLNIMKW
jgi:hypothetical protein